LLDSLVIEKKYKKKKLSNLMMCFNNTIIKELGFFSFLICNNHLVNFYKKNNWKILNKNFFSVEDHKFFENGMVFNNKISLDKYFFYFNK